MSQRTGERTKAAKRLDELRRRWLNPPDLVRIKPEVVPGYPDRILPKDDAAAAVLKTRTLTNLYNQRPAWLDNAHRDLDQAVAVAYGLARGYFHRGCLSTPARTQLGPTEPKPVAFEAASE